MWVVLIAVVLIIAGAVVVAVFRHPKGNDLSSVRRYHSALGTIEHLSERSGRSTIRVVGADDGPNREAVSAGERNHEGGAAGSSPDADGSEWGAGLQTGVGGSGHVRTVPGTDRWMPPVPVRRNGELLDPENPLVFDDSRSHDNIRRESSTQGSPRSRPDRIQKHALESMNRRPRRGTTVMIVVIALALFGVLTFLGSRRSGPSHAHSPSTSAASSASATSSSAVRTTESTTATSRGSGQSHHRGQAGKQGKKSTTTPTPAPSQMVAVSSTPGAAVYSVPANSYNVSVTASAPCWVLAKDASSGSTLWTGTLQTGATQLIQATGVVTVELGAPSASLRVGGVPVVLPTPVQTPFVARFQPAAATPGSTTTSTTANTTTNTSA